MEITSLDPATCIGEFSSSSEVDGEEILSTASFVITSPLTYEFISTTGDLTNLGHAVRISGDAKR
jgi:hypothetical protein